MTGTVGNDNGELLAAGAVLPADARDAGPSAVELTARAYHHTVLGEDRVVVRLAAAELGSAEDLAASFLGLEPHGEPAVVGLGRRRELGFPEWVLVHHPEDGHHALAVVPELDRLARQARTKPKAALDACHELAGRLAQSVPHFLPLFYEQAARVFLGVENSTYAGQLFGRARASEAQHGLTVDENRLDAVFLEFALAGALPVKVLTGYGKDLSARLAPVEAYERFRRLCVRRTAGGLAPSAQAATELKRLARAAALSGNEAEQDYLAELLPLPATLRAAAGWWKSHRGALVALARRVPSVRGTLLSMDPPGDNGETAELWLGILADSGADAGLADAGLPQEEQCSDGAAGWLERFYNARHRGWGPRPTPPALLELTGRAAGRIRADLAARPEDGRFLRIGTEDANLLDLLLQLDIAVADPETKPTRHRRDNALNLSDWADSEQPRDLVALAADPRFRPAFGRGADNYNNASSGADVMRKLAASPGGRPMLTEWMREVAASSVTTGLPGLPKTIERLSWLPSEALALAPQEVAAAAGADLGEAVARTLQGGLWEELRWPAWEEALAELAPGPHTTEGLTVCEAWPYLIVANATQARVIDADSTVLVHDLRVPTTSVWQRGFHYVDGALLVFWSTYGRGEPQGYWHTAPDTVFALAGTDSWAMRSDHLSLQLPGGGRATGGGVLHRGDTKLPAEHALLSDGTSYWVWQAGDGEDKGGWLEYDPVSGAHGRRSQPGFLADALLPHAPGAELAAASCRLRPAPAVADPAPGTSADGLVGWRVVRLPDGSHHGEDTTGRSVTLPKGAGRPVAALTFPGDDRPRALTQQWRELSLSDPQGLVTATAECDHRNELYGTAARALPPLPYLHMLRPRDPQGSAALRHTDAETAGALLKAAALAERAADLPALVSTALPQLSAPELIAGVVKVLRFAVRQQKTLDAVAARLDPATGPAETRTQGPSDHTLAKALHGIVSTGYHRYGADTDVTHRYLETLASVRADTAATAPPGRLHLDLPPLPYSGLPFVSLLDEPAAIAYRAVAPGSDPEHRTALLEVLGRVDALGLASMAASAGHWRQVLVRLTTPHLHTPDGQRRSLAHRSVLPLGGGAALGFTEHNSEADGGWEFGALLHDPSGRFEVPGPYTLSSDTPVGDRVRGADWLTGFLTEARTRAAAPFLPDAADEFSDLTGVSRALARIVLAGMPDIDSWESNFLPAELRRTLGLKVAEAGHARDELRALPLGTRRAVLAALLPDDPARLWNQGPDITSAAAVWNEKVGRRRQVPDWLATEAARAARSGWPVHRALPALLEPASSPELATDVPWHIEGDRPATASPADAPFTSAVLTGSMSLTAWLAHRLPAGDPVRAALPSALTAVRQRLAAPGLLLSVGYCTSLADFRKVAGAPTETAPDHERYGAVLMATQDGQPQPAVRPALLDSTGSDPYLAALRGADQQPTAVETALRRAHDPAFARLLADPGAPAAGTADDEGQWWPQDPSRSVPGHVAEVAEARALTADAATLYLMLLAMPDPTDRNTARWTGWKPARLKAARAELAATDLVVSAVRARAGRSLFLPGAWSEQPTPLLPVEQWKLPMYGVATGGRPALGALVPVEPAAELFARAWQRILEGDLPRFEELKVRRTRRRR